MTYLQAIILGIIQGITEFLPISSSGHLVIVPFLLGWDLPEAQTFPFDVLVQFSTLFAVLIYYRNDLIEIATAMGKGIQEKKPFAATPARIGWLTGLATIPAGIVGYLLKDSISTAFSNPRLSALFLLVTAAFLFISEKVSKQTRSLDALNWKDAGLMGLAQALAVFPGISRSGSTISAGLANGLNRKTSGQFAFLMAIPIMTAAGVLSLVDLLNTPSPDGFFGILAVGFLTSGIVGFFSIKWLLKFISSHKLTPFAYYCAFLGIGTLAISFITSPPEIPMIVQQPTQESQPQESYLVTYQSAASGMLSNMNTCTDEVEDHAQILIQVMDTTQMPEISDVHISLGELSPAPMNAFLLGNEMILPAAADNSPIANLPSSALPSVFSGELSSIPALGEGCPACLEKEVKGTINIWHYPSGSPLKISIDKASRLRFSSGSFIAPTTREMIQALKSDPFSVGFLPGKMIDDQLKALIPPDGDAFAIPLPILASSNQDPDPILQSWLDCLQNSIN